MDNNDNNFSYNDNEVISKNRREEEKGAKYLHMSLFCWVEDVARLNLERYLPWP